MQSSFLVFHKLIEPVSKFISEQDQSLEKHHNQKLNYGRFFTLLLYFFASSPGNLKLFINTRLNQGLLPSALGFEAVPYSTFQDAFARFSPRLFQSVFQHLVQTLPLKAVPEFAALGVLCCVDGSLFPVINSMLWAEYTSNHQALKLHCFFELNRMIPIDFQIGCGHSSEREMLLRMAQTGVTYIADRGYMSFKLCFALIEKQAFFIFRTKTNLKFEIQRQLTVVLPPSVVNLFASVSDNLIRYDNDSYQHTYRLVCFTVHNETYNILTNRLDLNTFQIIMLYAYRWQIELLFRYLKRTLNGIHLIRHDCQGVTIHFYVILIVALLQLGFKQQLLDREPQNSDNTQVQRKKPTPSKNPSKTKSSRLDQASFLQLLGEPVKKYWKIGIHWLTALRDLLGQVFDHRTINILLEAI